MSKEYNLSIDDIIIIDNYLENPNFIRNIALNKKYRNHQIGENWRGFRNIPPLEEKIFFDVQKNIFGNLNKNYVEFNCFFHYYTSKDNKFINSNSIHKDIVGDEYIMYAAIIYLTPNVLKENSGTSFFDEQKNFIFSVENVFNRMILYPSNIFHSPSGFFGKSIENSRLTFNSFSRFKSSESD